MSPKDNSTIWKVLITTLVFRCRSEEFIYLMIRRYVYSERCNRIQKKVDFMFSKYDFWLFKNRNINILLIDFVSFTSKMPPLTRQLWNSILTCCPTLILLIQLKNQPNNMPKKQTQTHISFGNDSQQVSMSQLNYLIFLFCWISFAVNSKLSLIQTQNITNFYGPLAAHTDDICYVFR